MKSRSVQLAPSLLSADLADLAGAVEQCEAGGADALHIDVMDGHFVPNLTFGIPVIEALKKRTDLPLDVHLMVSNPGDLLEEYLAAGASWISVHWEASVHLDRLLHAIKEGGARCGVVLNPATPVEHVRPVLPVLDFVLLMSVNPGFSGQPFVPYVLEKARRLSRWIAEGEHDVQIEIDGGVTAHNVQEVVASGVEIFVSGSSVFGQADPVAAMKDLKQRAQAGLAEWKQ